jgi:hypothetical protein
MRHDTIPEALSQKDTSLMQVQDKIYILVGLKERDHLEGQGVDGRMGSEWILGRLAGGMWGGFNWLRIGTNWSVGWIQMAQDTN